MTSPITFHISEAQPAPTSGQPVSFHVSEIDHITQPAASSGSPALDRWRSESTGDRMSDVPGALAATGQAGIGAAKGAGSTISKLASMAAEAAGYVNPGLMAPGRAVSEKLADVQDKYLTPTNTEQEVGYYGEGAAEIALPMLKGAMALPSAARAGKAFQAAAAAAGSVPVDISEAGDAALRAKELADNGGKMPTLLNKFIRRATDPTQGPINYDGARDFYSNAGQQSIFQKLTTSPQMQRQIAMFRSGLGDAIQEAAEQAGVGDLYRGALKEYHQAMVLKGLGKYAAWAASLKLAHDLLGHDVTGFISGAVGQAVR